ncbi:MAG: hypothetical protein ACRD07_10785 [Acidimicrobiales bacterium]
MFSAVITVAVAARLAGSAMGRRRAVFDVGCVPHSLLIVLAFAIG